MTQQEDTDTVSTAAAIDLIQVCLAKNILTKPDLIKLNISTDTLKDLTSRIAESDFIALWDHIEQHPESNDIALRIGQTINPNAKGLLASWVSQTSTLKEALNTFVEHIPLMNPSESWQLSENNTACSLAFSFKSTKYYPDPAIERSMSSIVTWAKLLSGKELQITEANFTFPEPDYLESFHEVFGNNIKFNCQKNILIFPKISLELPIISSNNLLKEIIKNKAQFALKELNTDTLLSDKVTSLIQDLISKQQPISVSIISDQLNMSRQTLYRELKKQNTDFKSLFDSTRKDQAMLLLSSGDETIENISLKLGYKDSSSFYKAFKRWYGQSPIAHLKSRIPT